MFALARCFVKERSVLPPRKSSKATSLIKPSGPQATSRCFLSRPAVPGAPGPGTALAPCQRHRRGSGHRTNPGATSPPPPIIDMAREGGSEFQSLSFYGSRGFVCSSRTRPLVPDPVAVAFNVTCVATQGRHRAQEAVAGGQRSPLPSAEKVPIPGGHCQRRPPPATIPGSNAGGWAGGDGNSLPALRKRRCL